MSTHNKPTNMNTLKKTTLALGCALLLTTPAWATTDYAEDEQWLDEAFETLELINIYDQNNDGLLSAAEIQQGVNRDINGYDRNQDKQLDLAEFGQLWNAELQKYMQQEFNSIDTNNSQSISNDELVVNYKQIEKRLFSQNCLAIDPGTEQEYQQEAYYEVVELDNDQDGQLNYTEFSYTERGYMIEDFRDIDSDGNGQLSIIEYQAALNDLALAASELKKELPVSC